MSCLLFVLVVDVGFGVCFFCVVVCLVGCLFACLLLLVAVVAVSSVFWCRG